MGATHRGMSLQYIPPKPNSPIKLEEEDVQKGVEKWQNAAVGFTVGDSPHFHVIKKFTESRWKELGKVDVLAPRNRVFLKMLGSNLGH